MSQARKRCPFICLLADVSVLRSIFLIYLQLLKKMYSYKMFYTAKQSLPTKWGHSLPEYIFDVFNIH